MSFSWWDQIHHVRRFLGYILWQLKQYGAGLFLFCDTKGFSDKGRDRVCVDNLFGHFANWCKQLNNVDYLKLALFGLFNGFLPCDHDKRKASKKTIGCRSCKICCTGSKRRKTYSSLAGKPAIGCRHEGCALFMPRQNKFDFLGFSKRLQKVQVFFPGNSKNILHPFILQSLDK